MVIPAEDRTGFNLTGILGDIRRRAIEITSTVGSDWSALLDTTLPDPLHPMALLPVATGVAFGLPAMRVTPIAAAIVLASVALRIADDCADTDNPNALYTRIGLGPAINVVTLLNTLVAREFSRFPHPHYRTQRLIDAYHTAMFNVCEGQHRDMLHQAETLDAYLETTRLKTVVAYQFTTFAGAYLATVPDIQLNLCSRCGTHLGWMIQILNDIEALWFPTIPDPTACEYNTFPVLYGRTLPHPNAQALDQALTSDNIDRLQVCGLLDEMNVRALLMSMALDHKDQAIAALSDMLRPEGKVILEIWLNYLWRNGRSLLENSTF